MRRLFAFAFLAAALWASAPPAATSAASARIVAVGDVHGAFDAFTGILRTAGVIDEQNRWSGGKTILVQTGDVTDRGAGVKDAFDLLMALEPQASKAGGRVEVLLGNHEMMNLVGNVRDTTPEIHAAFGGLPAYRDAFRPNGRYGKWLRAKPVAVSIDGTLFMHAGVAPEQPFASVTDVNTRTRADLKAWDEGVRWMEAEKLVARDATMQEVVAAAQAQLAKLEEKRAAAGGLPEDGVRAARVMIPIAQIASSSLFAGDGPMWFRGYATWTDEEGRSKTEALLKEFGVQRIVTGHSPLASGRITPRFDARLILIDTGMLGAPTYKTGRASALEIDGAVVTAIYSDGRIELARR